jgi:hypothetical protein
MSVRSGRSRIADLEFQVFNRTLHPEWFTTREFRRVGRTRWEADLRIVEGGHVIMFRSEGVRIVETLYGLEAALPEPGPVFHRPLRHEQYASIRPGGTVSYQSCFAVERLAPEVFRHLSEEFTVIAPAGRLFHRFPRSNRLSPEPISQIHVDSMVQHLSVQCVHTFPDECAIVRTQSLFDLVPAKT